MRTWIGEKWKGQRRRRGFSGGGARFEREGRAPATRRSTVPRTRSPHPHSLENEARTVSAGDPLAGRGRSASRRERNSRKTIRPENAPVMRRALRRARRTSATEAPAPTRIIRAGMESPARRVVYPPPGSAEMGLKQPAESRMAPRSPRRTARGSLVRLRLAMGFSSRPGSEPGSSCRWQDRSCRPVFRRHRTMVILPRCRSRREQVRRGSRRRARRWQQGGEGREGRIRVRLTFQSDQGAA